MMNDAELIERAKEAAKMFSHLPLTQKENLTWAVEGYGCWIVARDQQGKRVIKMSRGYLVKPEDAQ